MLLPLAHDHALDDCAFFGCAIRGSFVIAPVEDKDSSALLAGPEFLWPFVAESNARHFLAYLRNYFDIRGTRAEIFGIEGFVLRA